MTDETSSVPIKVKALLIDEYEADGWTHRQAEVATPAWEDIAFSIRALDQRSLPSVHLLLDPMRTADECMVVMGGQGAYWVAVTAGPHDQRRLFDARKPSHQVTLWSSDQGFADHAWHVCDLATALRAARRFAEHGDCDPELQWEA